MTDYAPPQPKAPPGSDFARYLEHEWPRHLEAMRAERDAAEAARADRGTFRCGFGGQPPCEVRLERRGLCDEHKALIRSLMDKPATETAKTSGPAGPKPRKINPADLFDAGDRARVPANERAAHAARWLHDGGAAVTRADFVRVAGVDPVNGASRSVLAVAVERGWIRRGPGGCVLPGTVEPS